MSLAFEDDALLTSTFSLKQSLRTDDLGLDFDLKILSMNKELL